ncbi:protein gp37 [Novosphingobium chloroacetimidivorans]|uniref:Protein gp37 n=1 Tax=Novosphingobium chloroacetimidivorans TaxID=1428314 RepID=A0A7W7KAW2_9SPHN|nr:phage Gp37/Gp68 family protein [Novosphingobium chloroacetimidivorans]MBB4859437.1 protein gp37 [Novosphingobium chloroacetimidivorans]
MSDIEWTERTWNPIGGCSRISAGCDHCYAIVMANRLKSTVQKYEGTVVEDDGRIDWTGKIGRADDKEFFRPVNLKKPTIWFVNSMSDMFHENVADADLIEMFRVMQNTSRHRYQILTKRPSRMALKTKELGLVWTPNMWAGVTIEEDKYARPRLRELLKVPASVRFVSAEPLLSALPNLDVAAIDWLISGGESGVARTVRPSNPDWHRDLRDRCRAVGTPFFFKQWGAFGATGARARSKKNTGSLLEGEIVQQMPSDVYDAIDNPRPNWTRIEARTRCSVPDEPASWLDLCVSTSSPTPDDHDDAWLRLAGV